MYMKEIPNLHTHTQYTLNSDSFGVVKCSLRVEGRTGWEGRIKNGRSKNETYDYFRID